MSCLWRRKRSEHIEAGSSWYSGAANGGALSHKNCPSSIVEAYSTPAQPQRLAIKQSKSMGKSTLVLVIIAVVVVVFAAALVVSFFALAGRRVVAR
jgi:hypothetical protein